MRFLKLWLPRMFMGIVPVPVTVNSFRRDVEGKFSRYIYNISLPGVLATQLQTPLHKIESYTAISKTQTVQVTPGSSRGLLNVNVSATPDNNVIVKILGV